MDKHQQTPSYASGSSEEALRMLQTSREGLSTEEVKKRQQQFGENIIKSRETHGWNIFIRQLQSPFIYLLVGAALLAFGLGETINASLIMIFVAINTFLGFTQEYSSHRTLQLLQKMIVSTVMVRRGGKDLSVDSHAIVPGDIVLLKAGDTVPADGRIISGNTITVDESMISGESTPVSKSEQMFADKADFIHSPKMLFAGTTLIEGAAEMAVTSIGANSVLGSIAKLTTETRHISLFEKGIYRFSVFILKLVVITLIITLILNVALKGGGANIGDLVIFAIALAVSVVPEALPVVITFALSRGAMRLSKHKVVVKRLSAIEDLGGLEILCSDKTGTLTENRLKVGEIFGDRQAVLHAANIATPLSLNKKTKQNNSFDLALWQSLTAAEQQNVSGAHKIMEIPFDPVRKINSMLVADRQTAKLIIRGAAESVMPACTNLTSTEQQALSEWLEMEGQSGKRTIVIAEKSWHQQAFTHQDESTGFSLVGAVSFIDPLKPSTKGAVAQAKKLGLQVKILTGDAPSVAGSVGMQIGLIDRISNVITGEQFEKLNALEQEQAVASYHIFARVSPEQKHRLIEIMQKSHAVGFLGEGINDAPALKIANVGLVVKGAADVAQQSADIVLLEAGLEVIVEGIKQGREVFANTIKYIRASLASNFGNFYSLAIASLFIDFLPMLPIQILLVNLLSDFPMIAVATDSVDKDELKRPQEYNLRDITLLTTLLGIVSSIFDFAFFGAFYRISPQVLQTNWFIGSILTELALLYSIRTRFAFFNARKPSFALSSLTLIAASFTILIPLSEWGRKLFSFSIPTPSHLVFILGIVCLYFIATESVKILFYKLSNKKLEVRDIDPVS